MKKVVKFLYPILSLLLLTMLTACSSKPPKYNGESAEEWGKKIGAYYGEKIKKAGNKNMIKFLDESNKVFDDYKNKLKTIKNNDEMVELVDNTIEKIIDLSDKYLDISEDDYDYLTNPLKYYHIEDDYPPLVQNLFGKSAPHFWWGVKYAMTQLYGKPMYSPFDVVDALDYLDKEKYKYIASHSKYKKYFYK
jgi:uncharacterized lipoprotein YehR (DUF1307 family)